MIRDREKTKEKEKDYPLGDTSHSKRCLSEKKKRRKGLIILWIGAVPDRRCCLEAPGCSLLLLSFLVEIETENPRLQVAKT